MKCLTLTRLTFWTDVTGGGEATSDPDFTGGGDVLPANRVDIPRSGGSSAAIGAAASQLCRDGAATVNTMRTHEFVSATQ